MNEALESDVSTVTMGGEDDDDASTMEENGRKRHNHTRRTAGDTIVNSLEKRNIRKYVLVS